VAETHRDRWIARTVAGLAETALLRGDEQRAVELFAEARAHFVAGHEDAGVALVDERLRGRDGAKTTQRSPR